MRAVITLAALSAVLIVVGLALDFALYESHHVMAAIELLF